MFQENQSALELSSVSTSRPNRAMRRREKHFGYGRCVPLDGFAKLRIQRRARELMRPTEPRKHYGPITAKYFEVLKALLWKFHNAATGRCFPSYETIAEKADCSPSTVGDAIKALEAEGLLTWVNRIDRVYERVAGLFGKDSAIRERVIRTSNAYVLIDPQPSKTEIKRGTTNQFFSLEENAEDPVIRKLHQSLRGLGNAVKGKGAAPDGAAKGLSR